MSYTTKVLQAPVDVLQQLVWLLIARRLYDDHGSYETIYEQWPVLFGVFRLEFRVATHTERNSTVRTEVFEHSYWDLLTTMKINIEFTDFCTRTAQSIFQQLRSTTASFKQYARICHYFIQFIAFFGSRKCLKDLHDFVFEHSGGLCSRGLAAKMTSLIRKLPFPHEWFTRSFCPNRITRSQVKKASRPHAVTLRLLREFRAKAGWKQCGLRRARLRSKRFVASRLGRQLGPFVGKNFFQLCKLAAPSLFAKARERLVESYTETGPGCRGALNVLEGWPKSVNIYGNRQDIADQYNVLLNKWRKKWKSECLKAMAQLPEELRVHAQWLGELDEGGFQFVLCELVKIIAYSETENKIYTRDHWADRL